MKPTSTRSRSAVARPVGSVFAGLAIGMLLCAATGVLLQWWWPQDLDRGSVLALVVSAGISGTIGAGLIAWGRGAESVFLSRRDAILAVALIWFGSGVLGGLPFVLHSGIAPIDAFFEAVSGFTTTGATIVEDIEGTLARPILLWRSLMQWLGGMGIVVLFVAVFPNLGVGAKHMFRSEVPGPTAEGLQPRIAETSVILWGLYAAFTLAEILILWALGMSLFDAVCHAFTTMSTGGFSTRNASIAAYGSPAIEMVIALFMLLAGVNFALYSGVLRKRSLRVLFQSSEFIVYMGGAVLITLALAALILPVHPEPLQALRYAVFMVATTLSSTGYGTDAYMAYPAPALMLVAIMMFVGASAGSTAGGLKVARAILLAKLSWGQIRRSVRPQVVHVVRVGRSAVDDAVLFDVAAFLGVFVLSLTVVTFLVTLTDGVPVITAFSATLSATSNMGPAPWFQGSDNYASYSGVAKLLFSVSMILGRLEFFTLLALLLPDFWRR